MNILRRGDYKVMPWKNGGGTTTEIWVSPQGSDLSGAPFDWRVSIADVAQDGPFSKFVGYDRNIMLLGGNGMRLETREGGNLDLVLCRPTAFSGDWTVEGRLVDGPVRDFNLMVARSFGQGRLVCQTLATPLPLTADGSIRLIHSIDGELSLGGHLLATGETAILTETESAVLSPLAEDGLIALCSVRRG